MWLWNTPLLSRPRSLNFCANEPRFDARLNKQSTTCSLIDPNKSYAHHPIHFRFRLKMKHDSISCTFYSKTKVQAAGKAHELFLLDMQFLRPCIATSGKVFRSFTIAERFETIEIPPAITFTKPYLCHISKDAIPKPCQIFLF